MAQLAAAAAPPPHVPSEPAPVAPLQQQQQQPVTVVPLQPPQAPAAATQRPPLSVLSLPMPGPFTFACCPTAAFCCRPRTPGAARRRHSPSRSQTPRMRTKAWEWARPPRLLPAATPSRERLLRAVARTASRPQRPAPPAAALPPNPPAYAVRRVPRACLHPLAARRQPCNSVPPGSTQPHPCTAPPLQLWGPTTWAEGLGQPRSQP